MKRPRVLLADGRALIEAAVRLRPEVIVADISMPRLNGLDACALLRVRMISVSRSCGPTLPLAPILRLSSASESRA